MALGWLLDTNVISELRVRQRASPNVVAWSDLVSPETCFVSTVTLAEIRYGIERLSDAVFRFELQSWLDGSVRKSFGRRMLAVDESVLLRWRLLSVAGQRARYTYAQPDALIAATALVHNLGVATRNTDDFVRAGVPIVNPWEHAA